MGGFMLPFLASLTTQQLGMLPMIEKGVTGGLSSRRITESLIAQGLAIKRQTLLDIMRYFSDKEKASNTIKYTRKDRLPKAENLPEAIGKIRRNFAFVIGYEGYDIRNDEPIKGFITLSRDTLTSPRALETEARNYLEDEEHQKYLMLNRVWFESGVRAGKMGVL
jgi:hypothetical protein